jgi:hypothetical protein
MTPSVVRGRLSVVVLRQLDARTGTQKADGDEQLTTDD